MQLKTRGINRCNEEQQKYIKKINLITVDNKPMYVYIASEVKFFTILYTRLKILGKTEFHMKRSKIVA